MQPFAARSPRQIKNFADSSSAFAADIRGNFKK
jgi:hypothetical protein